MKKFFKKEEAPSTTAEDILADLEEGVELPLELAVLDAEEIESLNDAPPPPPLSTPTKTKRAEEPKEPSTPSTVASKVSQVSHAFSEALKEDVKLWSTTKKVLAVGTLVAGGLVIFVSISYIAKNPNAVVQRVGDDGEPGNQFPLGECMGDCDGDQDCKKGLVCFQRRGSYKEVPGCVGGDWDESFTDYCVKPFVVESVYTDYSYGEGEGEGEGDGAESDEKIISEEVDTKVDTKEVDTTVSSATPSNATEADPVF